MTTSVMMGDAAPAHSIEFGGRRYALRKMSRELGAIYKRDLVARIRDAAIEVYGEGTEGLRQELAQLTKDVVMGVYEWEETFVQGALVCEEETRDGVKGYVLTRQGGYVRTVSGMAALMLLLFECTEKELEALIEAKRVELEHLIELTLAESLGGTRVAWQPGEPPKNARAAPETKPRAASNA